MSVRDSEGLENDIEKQIRRKAELKQSLLGLPKPKNEFQFTIPDIEEEEKQVQQEKIIDEEVQLTHTKKAKIKAFEKQLKMRYFLKKFFLSILQKFGYSKKFAQALCYHARSLRGHLE